MSITPPRRKTHSDEKPYKCCVCEKGFRIKAQCVRHETIHGTEKNVECIACGKKFRDAKAVKLHSKVHSGELSFWCVKCDTSFRYKCNFKTHLRTCGVKNDGYFCSLCAHYYTDLNLFVKHMCTHTKTSDSICSKCGESFQDFALYSYHLMTCNSEKDIQFENPTNEKMPKDKIVDSAFMLEEELILPHVVSKANVQKTIVKSKKTQKINSNENYNFKKESDFKEEEEDEESAEETENDSFSEEEIEDRKLLKCSECDNFFELEDDLMEHIITHAMKDNEFYCKTCNQNFRRQASFINHWKRNHSEFSKNDKLAEVYRKINKARKQKTNNVKHTVHKMCFVKLERFDDAVHPNDDTSIVA